MYSGVSLRFLKSFPTSYSILQTDKETLYAKIIELFSSRRGRSEEWINERVKRPLEAAKQNPFEQTMYSSPLINLNVLIILILQYQEHLTELEQNIDALAEEIEEYDLIQSIPCMSHTPPESCKNSIVFIFCIGIKYKTNDKSGIRGHPTEIHSKFRMRKVMNQNFIPSFL
ncbi:hypothetical protein [Paenibacillus sp. FSL H7-0331]|nr:hypothetical protein [Paenibacillus sp. FSL H7-0331]